MKKTEQLKVLLIDEFGGGLSKGIRDELNLKVDLHYSGREAISTRNPKDYDIAIIDLKNHYERTFSNTPHIAKYLKENNPKITTILICYLPENYPNYIPDLENYDEKVHFIVSEDNISKIHEVLIKKGLLSKIK